MVAGSAGPERLPAELAAIFPDTPLALMTGVPPKRRAALGVTHDRGPREAVRAGDVDRPRERHAGEPGADRGVVKILPGAAAFAAARASGASGAPLAVAIGNFDGVHRGHQALLDEARARGGAAAGRRRC